MSRGKVGVLLAEFRSGLTELYGDRLRGVYLFGSYARAEEDAESDLDVLVVLDEFASYADEIDRVSELAARLSLQYELSISKVFVRERDWRDSDAPFIENVRAEAVSA